MTVVGPLIGLISTSREWRSLAGIYAPIAIGVFALVVVLTIGAVIRYRGDRTPSRRSELVRVEGSYAVLLACVAALLLVLTLTAEHRVDTVADQERPSLVVDVTAARWEWEFRYPADGIVAHSGLVGHQPLVVPADRAIRFNLTSQDVIHSMWIPQLDFKRDLIRGAVEHVTLTFTRTGSFDGQCAEFCGVHHPEMVFVVQVMTPTRFDRWAAAHRGGTT